MPAKSDYWKDPDKYRAASKDYYRKNGINPDVARAASKAYYWRNREAVLAKVKARRDADPEPIRERQRKERAALRLRVFALLGERCACCGESDMSFLTVDHIHGGGRKHFIERGTWGAWRDILRDADALANYQTLCANCNMAKARLGRCPHALKHHK